MARRRGGSWGSRVGTVYVFFLLSTSIRQGRPFVSDDLLDQSAGLPF